jgi:FKBP-type peptidyl-prolyl cis-trans isomerase FkpA
MTRWAWLSFCVLGACAHSAPKSEPRASTNIVVPKAEPGRESSDPPPRSLPADERTTESGLRIEEVRPGTGALAEPGHRVRMHYHGTLEDGTVFDSSRDRGVPFEFALGGGQVIKGFEEGVTGMRVGEVRRLTIPPELGYGATARGAIPANATLIFEIELLEVQ